jgi:hypothetical protein
MNERAASLAAAKRDGSTSMASIEIDVSVASMIVRALARHGHRGVRSREGEHERREGQEAPRRRAGGAARGHLRQHAREDVEVGEARRVAQAPALGGQVREHAERDEQQAEQDERPLEAHARTLPLVVRKPASVRSHSPRVDRTVCSAPVRRRSPSTSARSAAAAVL